MVISIALLGYGASGTFLALVRDRLRAARGRGVRRLRGAVRRHRGRLLRARRAAAVQRARADLGPAPAALPGRAVRDPVRAVLLRRRCASAWRSPASPSRSGASTGPICSAPGGGALGILGLLFLVAAEPGARADRRARPARGGAGQPRRGRPDARACARSATRPAPLPWRSRCRPRGPPCSSSPYKGLSQALRVPGRRGRGRALQPARPAQRGAQSARSRSATRRGSASTT